MTTHQTFKTRQTPRVPLALRALWLALALLVASTLPSLAQAADSPGASAQAGAHAADDMSDGEVRKIDAAQGKLTLKHGEIKNLDMPAMTMVFNVKDKAMLAPLKTGDKVKFKVISDNGKLVVTQIVPAP